MKLKKLFAATLAVVLLLSAVGCGSDKTTSDNTSDNIASNNTELVNSLTLLYRADDPLNPYTAKSLLNRRLSTLMYDPLVKVDSEFQPQFVLAKNIEISNKQCVVTLKSAVFSDGSAVTADDVVYSLKLALNSELAFKDQLALVKSYKADGSDKVVITLTKTDPYFANVLDLPIIKQNSDNLKDENKMLLPPIGSGRFVFDTKEMQLNANAMYIGGVPSVKTIRLIDAPDDTVVKYNLEVGNVSAYYSDLSDGVIPPMSGTSSTVNLNNLVYLGLNLENKHLTQPKIRYALSYAIDRLTVCNEAYYSYATPATGVFNVCWDDAGTLQNLPKSKDLQNVVAILEEIGYNNKDNEGFIVDSKGKNISFKLIAYKGNDRRLKAGQLVKQQLEAIGFKITLKELEWDEYTKALVEGNFDIYIAETKLPNNMDVTELLTADGSISYGIPTVEPTKSESNNQKPDSNISQDSNNTEDDKKDGESEEPKEPEFTSHIPLLEEAIKGFYGEQLSLVDIINAFNAEMPIIPLCHRQGISVCDSRLNAENMSSVSDVYFGIADKIETK